MEESLYIQPNLTISGSELWFTASLSGGPGGQHVNKVNSRVTLYWNVGCSQSVTEHQRSRVIAQLKSRISQEGIFRVTVDDHRSQHRNKEEARKRLVQLLQQALIKPKTRVATRVSLRAKRRRVNDKRRRSLSKKLRKSPSPNDY